MCTLFYLHLRTPQNVCEFFQISAWKFQFQPAPPNPPLDEAYFWKTMLSRNASRLAARLAAQRPMASSKYQPPRYISVQGWLTTVDISRSFALSSRVCQQQQDGAAAAPVSGYTVPADVTDFGGYRNKREQVAISEADLASAASLKALHARLHLEGLVPPATLARTLICQSAQSQYVDNAGMATFGRNLLNFYVYEHFMAKYPRLTPTVLQQTTDLYISTKALAQLAQSWGVEEDSRSALTRYLNDEHEAALFGRLRYSPSSARREDGVVELLSGQEIHAGRNGALATFARALVAAIYTHAGLDAAKTFIHDYVVKPKKLDLARMLTFEQPARELSRLCARENLASPVSRLLVETGRFTAKPVYVVGVFSADQKLGEGQGASLREAKTRAAVNALKAWYLYTPAPSDAKLPSDASKEGDEFKGAAVGTGSVVV